MSSDIGETEWSANLIPENLGSVGLQPEPRPGKQAQGAHIQASSLKAQLHRLSNLNPKSCFELKSQKSKAQFGLSVGQRL